LGIAGSTARAIAGIVMAIAVSVRVRIDFIHVI